MDHQPFETWLVSEEPLTPEQQSSLQAHLQDCPRCQNLERTWNQVETLLGERPVVQPAIGFTLDPAIRDGEKLACYGSERDGLTMRRLEGNRFEVKLASPLPPGRFRLSCTIPAGNGRFRWFGAPFYVPAR